MQQTFPSNAEKTVSQIDWKNLTKNRQYYPSPHDWRDEVIYFLFLDRFSDGKEHDGFKDSQGQPVIGPNQKRSTPKFNITDDAWQADRDTWFSSGKSWCGGNLAGLRDKLGYLKRLGVTSIWLSPVFRQVKGSNDYHGYGTQNFLDVDPHFGTREELKEMVKNAHDHGIRIILDIILNHAGNVFAYEGNHAYHYHEGMVWETNGLRHDLSDPGSIRFGDGVPESAWPDGAVWPQEFQSPETWTRKGQIRNWDGFPEYLEGDFMSLKDIDHGKGPSDPSLSWDLQRRVREFRSARALYYLIDVYKYWIAYADIDGCRLDTVKHMEPGAVRIFANAIHEYAQSIGKERFYLIGEVTGGRAHAVSTVNTTGIDAALGIDDIPDKLEFLAKGWRSPGNPETTAQEGYFDLFRNSVLDGMSTHQWYGEHVVVLFDDHDQVGTKHKYRFCGDSPNSYKLLKPALGLNLTSIGIPCIYYGTEQGFNGADHRTGAEDSYSDVFLRECMFGGPFGSLQSTDRHFFDENHEIYKFISEVIGVRNEHIELRRGRQYLRQVSITGDDGSFYYPQPVVGELRWVVGWSRIFAEKECICAINTDLDTPIDIWITVDAAVHSAGQRFRCLQSTDANQNGTEVSCQNKNGLAIQITVPACGFVIYSGRE